MSPGENGRYGMFLWPHHQPWHDLGSKSIVVAQGTRVSCCSVLASGAKRSTSSKVWAHLTLCILSNRLFQKA
jgi:hypothetical protein